MSARVRQRRKLGPLVRCPSCGKRVRQFREIPCPETAQCLARRVMKSYVAMGWVPAGMHGRIIWNAGLAAELAGTSVTTVPFDASKPDEWGVWGRRELARRAAGKKANFGIDVPADSWWAPAINVECARLLECARVTREQRAAALRLLVVDEDLRAAVQAACDLGGAHAVAVLARALARRSIEAGDDAHDGPQARPRPPAPGGGSTRDDVP